MKKFLALLLALTLALMLVGCGASKAPMEDAAMDMVTSDDAAMDMGFDAGGAPMEDFKEEAEYQSGAFEEYTSTTDGNKLKDVKMVYTANMDLQTLSFDKADADISALVEEMGGYFEQRSISNRSSGYRYAEYTVRVPAEKFNDFCSQMGTLCHLVYKNESADNITESYYDTQSRLVTAQTKLERLQELLRRAESMEDIITIESAISETEWTIENLTGTLRTYDSLVGYSTVYMSLSEVYELAGQGQAPVTFGDRLGESFLDGLKAIGRTAQNFAVWLAYSWFWLLIVVVIVIVVIRTIRRRKNGKPLFRLKKKAKTDSENQ
ncbi:MAG: DUF4349 domain-containing protein [Oscillospiraceae bacterium]|nr:DUF4349 domain-containing protein [Oscillospiraceae bacterium]